ncbi:MAG: helix-hairpin-helix domain-containing protein [Cyclobacteriaceae bacterium]|nr:helix-hairpin-helix domain-containing protein [Cyclobacteriaceae bacterium]
MIKIRTVGLLMACLLCFDVNAQMDMAERLDFERIIERLLPLQEMDVDYNDLYDRLATLYAQPIDLNAADREGLQSLFLLSEIQIEAVLAYREKYGDFFTLYELMAIDGFDQLTIELLSPFVTVVTNPRLSLGESLASPDRHELHMRWQASLNQKRGYTPSDTSGGGKVSSRYAGDPNRLYARYTFAKKDHYSFGFTTEKDPGEKLIWDKATSRYGMDYYSFHGMIEHIGPIKRIIAGDFSMDFGQSLVYGSGVQMGKGYEPITTIRRANLGLRPYRSVYESKDFSGIGLSTGNDRWEVNAFYSFVWRDAIIRSSAESDTNQYVTYIQTIGLHRTTSEINAKNSVTDQTVGANASVKLYNKKLEVGLNAMQSSFSTAIVPGYKKYNQYEFRGKDNSVGSIYFNCYLKGAHAFGEMAVSQNGAQALVAGIISSLSSQVQASVLIRQYDRNFHSLHALGFGENSKTINETGMYWGLRLTPIRKLTLAGYFDYYRFPWLKYQVDSPSSGRDFMLSALYEPSRQLSVRVQYRHSMKEMNREVEDDPFVSIDKKNTQRFLFDLSHSLDRYFTIKTRVQYSAVTFAGNESKGFLLAQDVNFSSERIGFSGRFAVFDTDDYDTRQFIYERDLLYVYSVPFFYQTGVRYYLLGKFEINKRVSLWAKFSKTQYLDLEQIGSGLESVEGNKVSFMGIQLRIKL